MLLLFCGTNVVVQREMRKWRGLSVFVFFFQSQLVVVGLVLCFITDFAQKQIYMFLFFEGIDVVVDWI